MPTTTKSPLPTMQQTQVLARALAKRMAHQPADVDDLIQEALWVWHRRAQRKPFPTKPFALARTVMQRAMQTYYGGRWCRSGARHQEDLPFECAPQVSVVQEPGQGWEEKITLDAYFAALEKECGTVARLVAENLIMPRDLFYCRALDDVVFTRGKRKLRPSQQALRQVLHIPRTDWNALLKRIRAFTALWLTHTVVEGVELPEKVQRLVQKEVHTSAITTTI